MSDSPSTDPFEQPLSELSAYAESLSRRVHAGEDVDLDEYRLLAQRLAEQLEAARTQLERIVGPVDPEALNAKLQAKLSDEEYEHWVEFEKKRQLNSSASGDSSGEREQK